MPLITNYFGQFIKKLSWKIVKFLIWIRFPNIARISTADLAVWLKQDDVEKPSILDARTPQEYGVSHLENAKLVPANWEAFNNSVPIVVYCSIGYRSAAIVKQLQEKGYQKVFNLEGSIFQWANEHRPLYQGKETSDRVHPYNRFWGFLLF